MLADVVNFIVEAVAGMGYAGIFLLMLLESSFFPFPSEVVMVPAGYLASKGEMNLAWVIASGIGGSLVGALVNYYLALKAGRAFLMRFGRYMLIHERTIFQMEQFFEKHGHISTFSGRLIPGVRQYISLPAGIARMHLGQFMFFTTLGAGIWVIFLTLLGYYLGENEALIKTYTTQAVLIALAGLAVLIALYVWTKKRSRANDAD